MGTSGSLNKKYYCFAWADDNESVVSWGILPFLTGEIDCKQHNSLPELTNHEWAIVETVNVLFDAFPGMGYQEQKKDGVLFLTDLHGAVTVAPALRAVDALFEPFGYHVVCFRLDGKGRQQDEPAGREVAFRLKPAKTLLPGRMELWYSMLRSLDRKGVAKSVRYTKGIQALVTRHPADMSIRASFYLQCEQRLFAKRAKSHPKRAKEPVYDA